MPSLQPRNHPAVAAGAILLGVFCLCLSVALTGVPGVLAQWDRNLLLWLREVADPQRFPWLPVVVRDVTALGGRSVLGIGTLLVFLLLRLGRRPGAAGFFLAGMLLITLLPVLLKLLVERPRPELVTHLVAVSSSSFPSGHSLDAMAAYLMLALLARRWLNLRGRQPALLLVGAVLLGVAVGLSRLYLGVHWPSDVLAGGILGAAAALAWVRLGDARGWWR